jgi:diacylglycerol kinase
MNPEKFSVKSRFRSFIHAFNGLRLLLKSEHNARLHTLATMTAITAGIILKINLTEWCLIIFVIGLVFVTELINTSLETISDVVDPEWNEKIRDAKDYSAAAVLIAAFISVCVGALIFIPRLLQFF